jgi:uncharacterized membrane protein
MPERFEELDERAPSPAPARDRDAAGDGDSGYDIGRLLAFSDGVFAIAITLLVLGLPVPALADRESDAALLHALIGLGPTLATFALSFYLVGAFWIRHHRMFRSIVRVSRGLLWLNLLTLFLICLTPFTAGVFARYIGTYVAVVLYAGGLTLVGIAFSVVRIYVDRQGLLRVPLERRERLANVLQAVGMPISTIVFMLVFRYNGWVAGACLAAVQVGVNLARRRLRARPGTRR